uniref:Uncharacterized protein n=1 Tax=Megaselia scalaris TaxID=36166 RepID=T1GV45_MEGSC
MDSVKKEKDSDDEDERLKFDSEKFDPLFALYSPNLKINPQKNHVFQNFAMFEAALKRVGVYGLASKKKVTAHRTEKGAGAKVSIEDANAVRNFLPHQ